MILEIWSAKDRIFCHYGLLFALPPNSPSAHSPHPPPPHPPSPLMNSENQNFEKTKKALEDITFLQMFAINDSHTKYGFSDMECNRQTFLSFWTIF